MNNQNKPAFPLSGEKHQKAIGNGYSPEDIQGLTKREYFAAMAPPAPDWFHFESKIDKPTEPKSWETLRDDDPFKMEIKAWHHDPHYDLPEEVAWYQKAWEKYWKERDAQQRAVLNENYFAWRTYYADELLKQLEQK